MIIFPGVPGLYEQAFAAGEGLSLPLVKDNVMPLPPVRARCAGEDRDVYIYYPTSLVLEMPRKMTM